MNFNKFLLIPFLVFSFLHGICQNDGSYQMPPKDLSDMLLAKPTPGVTTDEKGIWMLFTESSIYPSVEELAKPEYKIAGLRINPNNYAPSRQNFIHNLYLRNLRDDKEF